MLIALMSTRAEIALLVAIGLVLLVPVGWRLARRRFDPFEPMVVFAAAYGVMFVVRPAAMLADGRLLYEGPLLDVDVSSTFTEMLMLALIGALAFTGGYFAPLARRVARKNKAVTNELLNADRAVAGVVVAAALAVCSFVVFLVSSGVSLQVFFKGRTAEVTAAILSTPAYLWSASLVLVPATVVIVAIAWERRSAKLLAVAVLLAGLVLLRAVPLGNRIALLPFFGALFALFYLRRGRRPHPMMLVAAATVALVASALLSVERARASRGESASAAALKVFSDPGYIVAPFVSSSDSEMAPAFAAALQAIPERLSYTYGRTIVGDLVIRPVPRALWHGKPLPPREKLISTVWPAEYEKGSLNPEFSPLLYFYWDFWIVGLVAGMAAYGVLARYGYEYFLRNSKRTVVQIVYALSLSFVVIAMREGPVDALILALFLVVPAWVICRIASARTGPRERESWRRAGARLTG
jgi:hypothetical protein